jgi:uncharacterized SAM-binding protein YcdF (DUF218 family)
MMRLDAVMVLGKELRRDPERARRELLARSVAAVVALRDGARRVITVEAKLRGQAESGSALVVEALLARGVLPGQVIQREQSRSTREEAMMARALCEEHKLGRLGVITAHYHLQRARRLFEEHFGPGEVELFTPESFAQRATEDERAVIFAATPSAETLAVEGRAEALLGTLAWALKPLPDALRFGLEVRAGGLLRRAEG